MGRQHQGVNWRWKKYHNTESREPRGVEEVGCKIYSGAPNGQPDYGIDKIRSSFSSSSSSSYLSFSAFCVPNSSKGDQSVHYVVTGTDHTAGLNHLYGSSSFSPPVPPPPSLPPLPLLRISPRPSSSSSFSPSSSSSSVSSACLSLNCSRSMYWRKCCVFHPILEVVTIRLRGWCLLALHSDGWFFRLLLPRLLLEPWCAS